MIYKEWNVGDVVRVVDEPYRECPFSWVDTMDEYCSREAMIRSKSFSTGYNTFRYEIDLDYGTHSWCGNCFETDVEEDEADFEVSEDDFEKLLFS